LLPWCYNVWFEGKLVEGYEPDDVIRNLTALYEGRIDFRKILFSGKPVLVEEDSPLEKAQKVFKTYEKAGAVCWIELVDIVERSLHNLVKIAIFCHVYNINLSNSSTMSLVSTALN